MAGVMTIPSFDVGAVTGWFDASGAGGGLGPLIPSFTLQCWSPHSPPMALWPDRAGRQG